LVLTLWLGEQYTPLTAFALIGTIITGAIVAIYIAVNLACISFFWRERRSEFNVIKHLLFPVLGIVLFVPAFFADLGIKLFSFISPLTYPAQPGRHRDRRLVRPRHRAGDLLRAAPSPANRRRGQGLHGGRRRRGSLNLSPSRRRCAISLTAAKRRTACTRAAWLVAASSITSQTEA
jgi:hypothetical protein